MTNAKPPLLPAVANERGDGTVYMSFGDPVTGPHEQFNFYGSLDLAQAIAEAYTARHDPKGLLALLRGAMAADDERLRLASARVGIDAGCDAPEMMAEEIQRLRSERGYVTGFNDGVEHAAMTPQQVMESNSAFSLGDLVRKKSGSWWQGHVVGHYSTDQTPDGVNVQLDMPKGPVQIFPAAAMELVDPPPAEPRENPQWTSEELQQSAAREAEPAQFVKLLSMIGTGHASALVGAQQLIDPSPDVTGRAVRLRKALENVLPMAEEHWANPDEISEIREARAALSTEANTPAPETHVAWDETAPTREYVATLKEEIERMRSELARLRSDRQYIVGHNEGFELAIKQAAAVAYRTCAETRHVTLGDKARAEIMALATMEGKDNA